MTLFTFEQQTYLNSSISENVYLEACPGSGKTEVVAAKVAKEVGQWTSLHRGIAVLSFANCATDELIKRIKKHFLGNVSFIPHFIGTFDSFIYKNIVNPLARELTGYTGVKADNSIQVLDKSTYVGFRAKYPINHQRISGHQYHFNLSNNVSFDTSYGSVFDKELNKMTLVEYQLQDLRSTKDKMFKAGFANYRDIEYLTLKAFTNEKTKKYTELLAKKYPIIIIDECQDLSIEQLQILNYLLTLGTKLHLIGDLQQSIYGFRGVAPEQISDFINANSFNKICLTRNFRSAQPIVDFCSRLVDNKGIVGNKKSMEPIIFLLQYSKQPNELIPRINDLCKNYKNCTVVSRGHSILKSFISNEQDLKSIEKFALSLRLYNPTNLKDLSASLTLFSEFLRNELEEKIKPNSFNCPYAITSNLKWRMFLKNSLEYLIANEPRDINNYNWSKWLKNIKESVQRLPEQTFVDEEVQQVINKLKDIKLRAPNGKANELVINSCNKTRSPSERFRLATIHGVKGESHDVTVLISSPKAGGDAESGGHWSHWLASPDKESARFAYVASSRPKYLLVWAVKQLKSEDITRFKELGFNIL